MPDFLHMVRDVQIEFHKQNVNTCKFTEKHPDKKLFFSVYSEASKKYFEIFSEKTEKYPEKTYGFLHMVRDI